MRDDKGEAEMNLDPIKKKKALRKKITQTVAYKRGRRDAITEVLRKIEAFEFNPIEKEELKELLGGDS